ncbi:hypothetical protein [Gemmobacter fulva]|nr:hypothetical protein [Gemmobacter fulvus]
MHRGNGTEACFLDAPSVLTLLPHQEACFPPQRGGASGGVGSASTLAGLTGKEGGANRPRTFRAASAPISTDSPTPMSTTAGRQTRFRCGCG